MPKLCQIIAVVSGGKTRVEKEVGDINKIAQKPELFTGLSRVYQPLEENGEQQPPESKYPQKSTGEMVTSIRRTLSGIMDAIATQEYGNTKAKADVIVDGKKILNGIPVTVLLYLEKQLDNLRTIVTNLPVLDPAERWTMDTQNNRYATEPTKTIRTKKITKPLLLAAATDKHPAQVDKIVEDVTVGHWTTTKFASVMSAVEKQGILNRINQLSDAVKVAREDANGCEVDNQSIAGPVLEYVFG